MSGEKRNDMSDSILGAAERPRMFRDVLMVCTGNICRSPTAAAVLSKYAQAGTLSVDSAGTHALRGRGMCPVARDVLDSNGFAAHDHAAKSLDASLLRRADLVLAMEAAQVQSIVSRFQFTRGKVFLLSKWCGGEDIPDPYRMSRPAYEHVFKLIDTSVRKWLDYL
ncbi:low molecular weight phosphotyrosine protein phosphatase [Burkholderia latens]|uniref:low molecular weight protein-tyrosine-phosphatase n=1 Tax=Burkholderia latens TaxID=488446 RepID=UPI001C984A5D|nr:low molecular weight protein-tyrosine-phosphatase [Burkholderia latens]MBY4695271.1 low molecular weight phosphotyrosine protein phosphatase [Burkholderia latens]